MSPETMILEDGSEVMTIHFLVTPRFGSAHLACMPGLKDFGLKGFRQVPIQRTDEPRSVNCPLCKRTEAYKKAEQVSRDAGLEWKS